MVMQARSTLSLLASLLTTDLGWGLGLRMHISAVGGLLLFGLLGEEWIALADDNFGRLRLARSQVPSSHTLLLLL